MKRFSIPDTPNFFPKIGPVLKYIEDLAQGMDGKFIVFFRHRLVRQAIEAKLVTLKLKYICIAGDVPSVIRGVRISVCSFNYSVCVIVC